MIATELRPNLRWMIRRDMPDVLDIEHRTHGERAWGEDEFIRQLRQRNTIGMVAEHEITLVGHMVYELHPNRLHLLNFTVHPDFRRMGVGTAMVNKLASKLSADRRNRIVVEARETNLGGHCFLRAVGFRAISVLRGFYGDEAEDAYLFQMKKPCVDLV